ncbi:MAG TPA: Wzz/FepE/Etk N-terminal domain-containing protein [Puia sp.]|nr:Wzz/FepE/Etk N-terminal domain-containing protein [Puia sp.]
MELTFLFRALMRRKWIILLSVIVAFAAAYLLTRNVKNEYKSSAQLSTGFTVSQDLKLSNENFNIPQIEVKFNNAIENITSSQVMNMVSYRLLLHDFQFPDAPFLPLPKKAKAPSIDKQAAILLLSSHLDSMTLLSPNLQAEKPLIDLLGMHGYDEGALSDGVKATRNQKTDYIDVVFISPNPVLSAYVVNTVCDEFKRFYFRNAHLRVDNSIVTLDSLVKVKKATLDAKQRAKEAFMAANGVLDVNLEGSDKLGQISNMENQLIEQKGIAKDASYRVGQLDGLINTAKNNGLTSIEAPSEITQSTAKAPADNSGYIRMRKQYNDLYNEYVQKGSNDPEMKKKLDNLSQSMAKENLLQSNEAQVASGNPSVVSINDLVQKRIDAQAALESAKQKITSIEARLSQLQQGLTGMGAKGVNLQEFDKEIQLASGEYTAAKDQLNMAINLSQNSSALHQTLIGVPASGPEKSKRTMILMGAGTGAFFLACLVVILLEFFDQSIKTPAQFHKLTDLPLIGTINRIRLIPGENVIAKVASFDAEEKNRNNTFLELLRKLRYELESSNKRVILFTSTEPQQGKTMLIQALSYILSLGKKSVLIIDTNFCNNDLTKNTNAQPNLEKFNSNGTPFNKSEFRKLTSPTSVASVEVIGCQGGDYTPTEILPKNHLLNYLDQIKEQYDFIFMEGAPLNSFTDTMELINYADGMIAVFSAEAQFTSLDKASVQFLEQNKSKFIGAILNKVEVNHLDI